MFWRVVPLVLALFAAWTLSGCASGSLSNVFRSQKKSALPPIAFAPIIGAPSNVSGQLTEQLVTHAKKQNIPVATQTGQPAEYTIRGYLAASQDKKSNKLAYIWDVTDKSGKRVHRILGEETTPAKPGRDAWSTFDQAALQKIASKTASDLATWLPTQAPAAAPQPAVATQKPTTRAPEERAPAPHTSARRREVTAYVPAVTGAPGDGRKSLTLALKKQLFKSGIKLSSTTGSNTYTVRGAVKLGKPSGGQQDIKIVWQVLSPSGQRLGTVSQANKVPQGSLDGPWGPVADAAATAAADGIVKLIPKR